VASTPATTARPKATNHGSRVSTASFVAGSENEKPRIPSAPRSSPPEAGTTIGRRVTVCVAITLLFVAMLQDNAGRILTDLRSLVAAGAPGSRLPSVRALTHRHKASAATVQRAIAQLSGEGLLDPRPGRGTFIRSATAPAADHGVTDVEDLSWQEPALGGERVRPGGLEELLALPASGAIPLSTGYLEPALQPTAALALSLSRAGRRPGAWDRLPVEGLPELRDWFATEIGGQTRGHDVVICSGGQSALGSAFRALGRPGEPVVVESPTYLGALAAARAAGLRVVPVPADADGLRPDLLTDVLERTGARLVYSQTAFANPHGAVLALERREPLLDAVTRAGAFLIEDDEHRDMAIDGPAPPPLAAADPGGHVVHLRSLTKVAAPGLRVAAIAARGAAGARLRAVRVVDDFFVSGPLQHAALDLVASPAWRKHKRELVGALRIRRDVLAAAIARDLPQTRIDRVATGGLHLWVRLPVGTDDLGLVRAAGTVGVVLSPGRPWFAGEPPAPHVRMTFGGASPALLEEGVRRVASTVRPAAIR
jgi:DNA-binding transcriptional MocR family regulator